MYRVLAAQVSVCTSIFGDGGRVKNAQRVSHIVGGRYQAARPCKEHAKVSVSVLSSWKAVLQKLTHQSPI